MKRIRYLTLLMLLLAGSTSLWAQDTFNPADPPEPTQPPVALELSVSPAEAGSASGGGRYEPGRQVSLSAYANTGFRFQRWTNEEGETISTAQSFKYTKGEGRERLTAHFTFDPSAPADPAEPTTIMYFKLSLAATDGGTVSGGGSYQAGKTVTLRAYPESGFYFGGWYDADGNCLSSNATYNYTTTAQHTMLTARFIFNPGDPTEPVEPTLKPKHLLTATCTEGGTISWTAKWLQEGESVTLAAYTNDGYAFQGWYLNGELYTMLTQFSYTVTTEEVQTFEARWIFAPADPTEPGAPTTTKHAFFLMNKVTKPDATVMFPIFLSNVSTLKDMTFQLSFPKALKPQMENVLMSEQATGYEVSYTLGDETDNEQNYVLSLVGGEVPAGNAAVLVFTINVPDDIATAQNYQVKINQVIVTETDGSTTTASTRNGRISVFKSGDVNGDDNVSPADAIMVLYDFFRVEQKGFISEVADMNDDSTVSPADAIEVLYVFFGGGSQSRAAADDEHTPEPQ